MSLSRISTTRRLIAAAGAGPDLVRLSIGIEDPADIIADIKQLNAEVDQGLADLEAMLR